MALPARTRGAARFRIEKRRSDWRLGRYAAKSAVGAFLAVDPTAVEVVAEPGGAPVAWLGGVRAELELSLSHRAGRALAVTAPPGKPVGCDLELVEPRSVAFIEQWLAPAESALVRAAPEPDRTWLANLIWSAKEASTKARGQGLRLDIARAEGDARWPARHPESMAPARGRLGSRSI
jgi:4'-phosphopantetheinyl transferase